MPVYKDTMGVRAIIFFSYKLIRTRYNLMFIVLERRILKCLLSRNHSTFLHQ